MKTALRLFGCGINTGIASWLSVMAGTKPEDKRWFDKTISALFPFLNFIVIFVFS